MKSLKIFFAGLALVVLGLPAFAQENNNRDENGKVVNGPYETNRLFDNWFVQIGGGADYVIDGILGSPRQYNGGVTPALNINVGKWFDPCFGARLGYEGFKVKAFNKLLGNNFVHGDLMWNISNQFGGYKETRTWNFIPYMTAGVMFGEYGTELAAGFGLLNNIRLSNRVGLFLDLRVAACRGEQFNCEGRSALATAALGLNVNLGKTNWRRGCSAALDAANQALAALEAANAALKAENDRLAAENEALKNAPAKVVNNTEFVKKLLDVTPGAFYFVIGKSVLSLKEKQHLEFYLQNIIENNDSKTYTVTGYADAATGTKAINMKLAQARAEYVAKALMEKGIDASKINIVNGGPITGEKLELLRSAVVEF